MIIPLLSALHVYKIETPEPKADIEQRLDKKEKDKRSKSYKKPSFPGRSPAS